MPPRGVEYSQACCYMQKLCQNNQNVLASYYLLFFLQNDVSRDKLCQCQDNCQNDH